MTTFIAVLVTFLVYLSGASHAGADWSQRLLLGIGQSPLSYVHHTERPPPPAWVLIDVELADCRGGAECTGSRFNRDALSRILSRVKSAQPRIVVLDVLTAGGMSGSPAVPPSLLPLLNGAGPPTLLAWAPKSSWHEPTTGAIYLSENDSALLADSAFGNARYLPAAIQGLPTARLLTPVICVEAAEGGVRPLPSLAYAAALVAAQPPGPGSIDAALARPGSGAAVESGGCGSSQWSPDAADYARTERVFSAASLFRRNAPGEASYWTSAGQWLHFTVSQQPGAELPAPAVLKDAVVLIGSADPDAEDVHWTSAGSLSGGEIVLNDIRQYLLSDPAPRKGAVRRTLAEYPFFLAGLAAAVLGHLLLPYPASGARTGRRGFFRHPAPRLALNFGLVFLITTLVFVGILALGWHPASPPDFVTPFIALFAGAAVELLYHLISLCRKLLGLHSHGGEGD